MPGCYRRSKMANIITGIRITVSIVLLFCPVFSPVFYALYIAAGISDVLDGAVARKTGTVSEFGSRLDTAADIIFAAVCLIKLLPVLDIPNWLYIWVAVIAAIKFGIIALEYIRHKKLVAVHSLLNKATGAVLFIFPLTLTFIDLKYSAAAVCIMATAAALMEGYAVFRETSDKQRVLCSDNDH